MFLTTLNIEQYGKRWKLTSPLIYRSHFLDADICVPAGFVTDLVSIPSWLPIAKLVFGDVGKEAAVIHDFLIVDHKIDRADADEVYLEALKSVRVPKWKRYAMHWGVSIYRELKGV